jgi:hypothetical protein
MASGNPQWFWNASENPFSQSCPPVWTAYSDSDNQKIEQAFKSGSTTAQLQNHVIHLREHMQVHKTDFNRQRPVKREPKE